MNTQREIMFDPQEPSADMLMWTYARGIFPMADPRRGEIGWFSPDPRGIIPLEAFHVPKNLAREVRKGGFDIRADTAFEEVMRACAAPRHDDNLSWINDRLIVAYVDLHRRGHAHSVEAWRDGQLVGGLYGVSLGAAFFGESMFSRPRRGGTNASKVCLVHLVRWLRHRRFTLLDTQYWNPHLDQFGCVEIPAGRYLSMLQSAVRAPVSWGCFEPAEESP